MMRSLSKLGLVATTLLSVQTARAQETPPAAPAEGETGGEVGTEATGAAAAQWSTRPRQCAGRAP